MPFCHKEQNKFKESNTIKGPLREKNFPMTHVNSKKKKKEVTNSVCYFLPVQSERLFVHLLEVG